MPDQPTSLASTPPGQNLAAPGSLAQVLSDHPRWPHGLLDALDGGEE